MTPSFISAARTLRPVGLIRSPMMTKGLSPEITTSRPREARRVSKNLTLAERLVDFHDGLLQSLRARRALAPIADVHGADAEPQALFSQRLHLWSAADYGVLAKG